MLKCHSHGREYRSLLVRVGINEWFYTQSRGFAIVFLKVFFVDFLKVVEIVGTYGIDAFVDDEMFTVFLTLKGMLAVRTSKRHLIIKAVVSGGESSLADITHELSCFTVVFVEI